MKEFALRKEVEITMERMEKDRERIEELAYMIWEKENGKLMEGMPVQGVGYKRVLRSLGFVI